MAKMMKTASVKPQVTVMYTIRRRHVLLNSAFSASVAFKQYYHRTEDIDDYKPTDKPTDLTMIPIITSACRTVWHPTHVRIS